MPREPPGHIPEVVAEDDECITYAIRAIARHKHYVLFPKKDIRNIAELGMKTAVTS
ncbi:MAG: hypothetical protein U1F34_08530 [Gammaproteobacteria bacterium]